MKENKKIMVYLFLTLISLTISASAIQDINITFDTQTGLCIQNENSQTCNITHVLQLDGTQDHKITVTPSTIISYDIIDYEKNSTEKIEYLTKNINVIFTAIAGVFFAFLIISSILYILITVVVGGI